jgi:hypothetical protein
MIAIPIFLQMGALEYNAMQTGLSMAPLSRSRCSGVAILAR